MSQWSSRESPTEHDFDEVPPRRAVLATGTLPVWLRRGRTAAWPVMEQFASPLAQLIMTPFLLHQLEPHQFGLWVVAQSLVVAAPTFSMGRSIALLTVIPRYTGAERDAYAYALVRRTLAIVAVVSLIVAMIAVLGNAVLGRYWPELASAGSLILLVVGFLALVECESTLTFALKSYRAFAQTAAIEITARALQVALVLTLVGAGAQVELIVTLAIVAVALKLVLKGVVLRRLVGHPVAKHSAAPQINAHNMTHLSFWSWINVVSGIAFYSFDRWAVGYFMGSVALAAYSVCSQLAQLTHAVPAAASQMLIPWASAKSRASAPRHTARQMRSVAIAGALLACLPPLLLLAFAPQILSLWISPTFAAQNTVLLRHLAFVFFLLTINIPFFNILIGLGFARHAALVTLSAGSLYAACAIVVAPHSLVTMANLKLIYAVIGLVFVVKLVQTLKGMTPR